MTALHERIRLLSRRLTDPVTAMLGGGYEYWTVHASPSSRSHSIAQQQRRDDPSRSPPAAPIAHQIILCSLLFVSSSAKKTKKKQKRSVYYHARGRERCLITRNATPQRAHRLLIHKTHGFHHTPALVWYRIPQKIVRFEAPLFVLFLL